MRRSAGVLGVIAALVGMPAAAGVVGQSAGTSPTSRIPVGTAGITASARAAAEPFLQLIGAPVRSCRFDGSGDSSIRCSLSPKGSCEIDPSAGRAECDQPGKGTTDYLILLASVP